ncbi:MAG: M48 family metallopeptidase [Gemmatimonadaceae bacterium]
MNLFEQQASNKRKSWLLVGAFLVFFAWLGFGGDLILWLASREVPLGEVEYVHRVPFLGILMVGAGIWIVLSVLRTGAEKVLWSTGAVPLTEAKTDAERQLENVVDEMAIAAGVPRPRIYIIPDADPNAFVTGSNPAMSHLAVTQGLLDTLNRDELQAVVAHEFGHVKNEDTQLMTLVAGLGGAILLIRDGVSRHMFRGGRGSSRSKGNGKGGNPLLILLLVLWVVSWLLAPLIVRLMAMGISRKREYLADAMAAQFTRNPMALADALDKIDRAVHPTKTITAGAAHLCIADPTGRWANSHEGRVADLFATHPPMRLRVSRLRAMAFQAQKRAGDFPPK